MDPMQRIPRALGALATATALLLTAACGTGSEPSTEPGQLDVVVAFYPFQYVAERVAGSDAKVTNLTAPGAEPHDLELTPKQMASLSDADVVIYQSGFQPAVDEAIADAKPKHLVDVAQVVQLHTQTADGGHDHSDQAHQHDDGKAEHGEAGHGEDEHAHDHSHEGDGGHDHEPAAGSLDPHAWLDPANMEKVTTAVTDELKKAAPGGAAGFDANAAATHADLKRLDTEFRDGLKTCERREFITSHAAFGYLAETYDLTQIGLRGLSPDSEPSPARIAEVQQEAREHGVSTIFYETLVSPAVAQSVASDLGLATDVLDPLEGLTAESRGTNYIEVMESNLAALKKANACQ